MKHSMTTEVRESGAGAFSCAVHFRCACGDQGVLAFGATPQQARQAARRNADAHRRERTGIDTIRALGR